MTFTYKNATGESVTLRPTKPFFLSKLDGVGRIRQTINTFHAPEQDGAFYISSTIDMRNITIDGSVLANSPDEAFEYRKQLLKIFTPKQRGTLTYRDRQISCIVEETGIEFGIRQLSQMISVENDGDVPCGCTIVFTALGTVTNPELMNVDNGEVLRLLKTMSAGEVITVYTHFAGKRVISSLGGNEQNAFRYVDTASTFIQLAPGINTLRYRNLINPAKPERKITGINYLPVALGIPVNTQTSYKNLMNVIIDLCDAADVGIKTVFAPNSGAFNIMLYKGAVSQAVFSKEYENIIDQMFSQSVTGYASFALVGGEGEGGGRTLVSVCGGEDADRYEIFVDAKDLRSTDFPGIYTDALDFRGQQKLAEQAMVEAFDATVNQYGNLKYKIDFDLGCNIKVISKRWSVSLSARITEVEESYDRNGMSLSVTFGKPLLTLAQKLVGGI